MISFRVEIPTRPTENVNDTYTWCDECYEIMRAKDRNWFKIGLFELPEPLSQYCCYCNGEEDNDESL